MTVSVSQQHWNDAQNQATSPMISPRYTSSHKRQLTSELRQTLPKALPQLMLLGNESSSSLSSSSLSIMSASSSTLSLERRKRTLSFRQQLKIAEEPLRRMLQEKQQHIQRQRRPTTTMTTAAACSEHAPSRALVKATQKVVSPCSLTLCAPTMNKTIATGFHFL